MEAELDGLVDIHEVIRQGDDGRLAAHFLLVVFFGRWIAGEPTAGSDAAAARFVPIGSIGALRMTDAAPEFIRRSWAMLETAQGS